MTRQLGVLTAGIAALALAGCVTATGPGAPDASRAAVAAAGTPAHTPVSEAERDPNRLRTLGPDSVAHLIGMPHYVRREGGATVWQYHAGGCVMDLFWYPAAGGLHLVHYEVRGVRLAGTAEARTCFGDLLASQRHDVTS